MRKIAIASEGQSVCDHFGHCEGFTIYTTQSGEITGQDYLPNPGHVPGLLPKLLNEYGIDVIIAGGMGAGAINIFNDKNIAVITGARGLLDQTIDRYLTGSLLSTGSICHEHQHAGDCNGH
ncbi:MAG: NifB/NifX family molybdenum-iron cluster-binding protein [Eubacteriales bacterium]|nr:NifB/NifX family molybdenum-iron cluster-binding protein [Eubacteriales bacterium]